MYWNNPIREFKWPNNQDPIHISFHQGQHCLFWNPATRFNNVTTNQRLQDLCNWAQSWLDQEGLDNFVQDERNGYDCANLVKLNMWIQDIRAQGIIKPWMMLDCGDGTFLAGNGDSRLRCLERIPEIQTVPAFITTTVDRAELYSHLQPVTNFDQFAELCGAVPGQNFLFRFTDASAPYGIYWYEFDSHKTTAVTPSQSDAVKMFYNYAKTVPELRITPEWFDSDINWSMYR